MSNNEYFETNGYLDNDDEVISFLGNSVNSLCKVGYFKKIIGDFLLNNFPGQFVDFLSKSDIKNLGIIKPPKYNANNHTWLTYNHKWLTEGKECEILKVGSNGWKKGKIRLKITLEFIPDEPEIKQMESPLDDIRQTMNQSN